MENLIRILSDSEEILIDKIIQYAKKQDYVKYTSTLSEAWEQSISGLTRTLIAAMRHSAEVPEMGPDDDFSKDETYQFGTVEAKKHRVRGITLSMYMGLLKYYRQSYLDLIQESAFSTEETAYYLLYIGRCFDHIELGVIMEWKDLSERERLLELQDGNRKITNEKNKYLTVFESIYDPILLINKDNRIENINSNAAELFFSDAISKGSYTSHFRPKTMPDWLAEELTAFSDSNRNEYQLEKSLETKTGQKTFLVKYNKMLDISDKYKGTVMIFHDITERKKMEKELKIRNDILEIYAYSDPMTGVLNRRVGLLMLEKELTETCEKGVPFSVCFLDLDGLKIVNDTYGHAEGDFMINTIVLCIQSCVREKDSVSRLGGDEFLIIFPDYHESEAEQTIRNIYAELEKQKQKTKKPYTYSFSYGIIEVHDGTQTANEILRSADEKMYLHKYSKKK